MILASELTGENKPAVGDRAFCVRGDKPQIVTITAVIDGGAFFYVRLGGNSHSEFVVRAADLSYASYSDCEAWIAARQASGKPAAPPPPATVHKTYTPPPMAPSQLSLFG